MSAWQILIGDVRDRLADLPDRSIQTVVTSPPYWKQRDYQANGQIGQESTPDAYVATLVDVFRQVRRVLSASGTLWIVLGDTYAGAGFTAKDLIGIPWRVAFGLQADGWCLRSDVIWHKLNPMPESVTDRPTKAHEYMFLLAKSKRYFYDAAAIAEPLSDLTIRDRANRGRPVRGNGRGVPDRSDPGDDRGLACGESGATRNKRSVWSVSTQPYGGDHFAAYPEDLIEPCILAGSRPGDVVLDPFVGTGTTGVVAIRRQRRFVGIELNAAYAEQARQRIGTTSPLFAAEVPDATTDDQLALWT